jgi:hypothetical protein
MFTWICPQCGREVPPSYTECPVCAERRQQAAQPAPPPQFAAPPPQPPAYAQPQYVAPPPPPPQPAYAPQPPQQQVYTLTEQKKGMPTWLVGVLTIAVLGGGLFGLIKFVGGPSTPAPTKAALPGDSKAHPLQKYLEVAGVRLLESERKKPLVRYSVINHSAADLSGLELTLVLTPTTGGEPLAVIDAKVGTVPAQGIKDMEAPLNTKLKFYELPDWQFLKSTFVVTAPPR